LRDASRRMLSPGAALERSNDLICPDIPPSMFITCLYAILDPDTGKMQYANAGHDLPYRRCSEQVEELRATGMPLGLMPGMKYEEKETTLEAGDSLLMYTDGLVEAHNPKREMYGFPRLQKLLGVIRDHEGTALIRSLLDDLASFTEPGWEQEDDVTLVAVRHDYNAPSSHAQTASAWTTIADFTVPSEPGNERIAMKGVAEAISPLGLAEDRLERLKTAVAEATMNAIEYGNKNRADLLVTIRVLKSAGQLAVRITDQGGRQEIPDAPTPDLEAKLAGLQSPRGWGLFLIKNLVDEMNIIPDDDSNTFELVVNLKEGKNDN
jgi:anti-sigma regulatory factor (Ser/Thr protein kinase)